MTKGTRLTQALAIRDAALNIIETNGEATSPLSPTSMFKSREVYHDGLHIMVHDIVLNDQQKYDNAVARQSTGRPRYPACIVDIWPTPSVKGHGKVFSLRWANEGAEITSFKRGDWERKFVS